MKLMLGLGMPAGVVTDFSPLSLSPHLWLDPSDLSTLFQDAAMTTPVTADGDPVGAIINKGSGGDWTQSTAGSRPAYRTSGGLRWIELDGTDDYLANGLSSVQTVGMAVRITTAGTLLTWFNNDNDENNQRLADGGGGSWKGAGGAGDAAPNSGDFSQNGSFFVNGVETVAYTLDQDHVIRTVAASAKSTGAIGRASAAVGRYADGRLYGLVGVGGTLNASQAANLDTWLGAKAGLTL